MNYDSVPNRDLTIVKKKSTRCEKPSKVEGDKNKK